MSIIKSVLALVHAMNISHFSHYYRTRKIQTFLLICDGIPVVQAELDWSHCMMSRMCEFQATAKHCTQVRFASFLSGGFVTAIVVNSPEMKLAKLQWCTDYGRPVKKSPSLHGRKSTLTPKFLGSLFHLSHRPNFQFSLIYDFIGCP